MSNVPVALQLFAVRGEVQKDLPKTLASVADIGYAGVEPYGYDGSETSWMGMTGPEIRKVLDDNGLTCCGIHLRTGALLGDNLQRTIEFNQQLGNRFLVIAADKDHMSTRDGISELADILNRTAAKLKPLDLWTGYHAHGFDFEEVAGKQAWYHLFGETADDVIMQLDIGNCAGGGGDPVDVLRTFPGRAKSVHLKDYGKQGGVIGEGEADWQTIFDLCDTTQPVEWYVVEECPPNGIGYDVPARALENLRKMGRA